MPLIRRLLLLCNLLLATATAALADPVSTGFTFQGYLEKDALPYTGFADFQLALHDAQSDGAQVGTTQTYTGIFVTQGLFTIGVDFGAVFDGSERWLSVAVQGAGDAGYTAFGGRLQVQATPYALWSPGGGGGSLALPFTGSALATGQTGNSDATQNAHALGVTNTATTGMSHGIVGVTMSPFVNAAGVVGIGAHGSGTTSGVQGIATASPLGTGIVGLGKANGGYFKAVSGGGNGVQGIADFGTGVYGWGSWSGGRFDGATESATGVVGSSATGLGVHGKATSGTGVRGEATTGWGMYGTSGSATGGIGVHGQVFSGIGSGVQGTHTGTDGAGQGVFGYASGNAVGVLGVSEAADGISGRSNASGKSGVFGYGGAPGAYGGFFTGVLGSTALRVDGRAQVKSLQILGGADLAERFPVREPVEPGTVLVIDPESPGRLRVAQAAYAATVAGVVSGANDLNAGIVLSDGEATEGTAAVALSGRVWVKADARSHGIRVGDLLTTSELAGHCMAATDAGRSHGAVLGKAMSSLPAGGTGMVLVLVSLR
jgi:hypothetical protein